MRHPSKYSLQGTTLFIAGFFIVGLLVSNVALLVQNRDLKLKAIGENLVPTVGRTMPPISGIDINDEKLDFRWNSDESKTLLLIFSPRCGFCHENMPSWNSIIEKIDKENFRILAVSSVQEGTKEFVEKYNLKGFPVISEPDARILVDYGMQVTPQTVLLDGNGRVEKIWLGAIQNDQKPEIEEVLFGNYQ